MTASREIEHAAARWLARRDGEHWNERDQRRLDAWLDASVAHRVAFLRLDTAWQQSSRLQALGAGWRTGGVPPRGSWAAPRTGAIAMAGQRPSMGSRPRRPGRARVRMLAVAASLLVIVSLALGWHWYGATEQASWRTAIGELREVPLADGSVATLSSDSRIRVTWSRRERHVDLLRGEAFFVVAKDRTRPFVVSADARRVIAVGTRFAVRRDAADLRVVVTQGLVRLESDSRPDGPHQATTLLPAGSVAVASDGGVVVHSGTVQQAREYLDWRDGFVSFHDTPLATAVAEFNRYNQRKIVIADERIGAMRVGGNFRWSNTEAFVRLLTRGFPIKVTTHGDTVVLSHR
ncbi:FecR family protein [Rhodanobacter lindaniclasticus]